MCTEMCGHGQLEGALVKNSIFQKPMYPCPKVQFIYTSNCILLQLVVTGHGFPALLGIHSLLNFGLLKTCFCRRLQSRRQSTVVVVVSVCLLYFSAHGITMPHASRSPIYPQAQRDLVVWFSSCLISFPLFTYINRCREISNPL